MFDRSPEKLVVRLRKRKHRILFLSVGSCFTLIMVVMYLSWVLPELSAKLVPKAGDDFVLHVIVALPLVLAIAGSHSMMLLVAVSSGLLTGALISELTSLTKNELLVELWDRVKALEKLSAKGEPTAPYRGLK